MIHDMNKFNVSCVLSSKEKDEKKVDLLKSFQTLRLILGDQLYENHSWFNNVDDSVLYVMMEMRQETDYVEHHIQKVLAFFAAMRHFSQRLSDHGHHVLYITLDDPENTQELTENLQHLITAKNIKRFEYQLPDEYRLDQQLGDFCESLDIKCQAYDSEHFLADRAAVAFHFQDKKQMVMESFYRMMRKRYDILMEQDKPLGGKWNYDVENRNRYDGNVPVPQPLNFKNDVSDLKALVESHNVKTMGRLDGSILPWPIHRDQALQMLQHFVDEMLPYFGTYQDAMSQEHEVLFHSRLSFALNSKMLHPQQVIDAALEAYELGGDTPTLPQIEGFVRQILGWREFMRGVYWAKMPEYETLNFFDHQRKLPHYYWDGKTQMNCMRHAIGQSLDSAYAHHIQRLMITGNFALLAGVHPDAVDAWYLGVYIDAIQWVELTNTRGMSQFADGGIVATKPYVSSANYIDKMSDYCSTCSYDKKQKTGERACPFNSLYWAFFERHRDKLSDNPRIGMMYRTWDRFSDDKKTEILAQAKTYLQDIEQL